MRKVFGFKITSFLIISLLVSGFSGINRASAEEVPTLESQEQEDVFKLLEDISVELEEEYPSEEALTEEEKVELAKIITEEVKLIENETDQAFEEAITEAEQYEEVTLKPTLQPSFAISAASVKYDYKTSYTVAKIYSTNLTTANSVKKNYDKFVKSNGLVYANAYRLATFYNLVKSNGAWVLMTS